MSRRIASLAGAAVIALAALTGCAAETTPETVCSENPQPTIASGVEVITRFISA